MSISPEPWNEIVIPGVSVMSMGGAVAECSGISLPCTAGAVPWEAPWEEWGQFNWKQGNREGARLGFDSGWGWGSQGRWLAGTPMPRHSFRTPWWTWVPMETQRGGGIAEQTPANDERINMRWQAWVENPDLPGPHADLATQWFKEHSTCLWSRLHTSLCNFLPCQA